MLGIGAVRRGEKYLGNPLWLPRYRSKQFIFLKEKIAHRLEGWRAKLLSVAGKATLIRSVLGSMSLYSSSTFRLPRAISDAIDATLRRFWWNGNLEGKRFLALARWEDLCKPKVVGGLGFRRTNDVNLALLAKLAWGVANQGTSLWSDILRTKYCSSTCFWECRPKSTDSIVWKGILEAREVIRKGGYYKIGNGKKVYIWTTPRIPWDVEGLPQPTFNSIREVDRPLLVNALLDDTNGWNVDKVRNLFDNECANKILAMEKLPVDCEDKLLWRGDKSGKFSVRGAYWVMNGGRFQGASQFWKGFWKARMHERHKVLVWRMIQDALPTRARLNRVFHVPNLSCPLCESDVETPLHILVTCPFSKTIWLASPWKLSLAGLWWGSVSDFIEWLMGLNGLQSKDKIMTFLGCLENVVWRERNDALFNHAAKEPHQVLLKVLLSFCEHDKEFDRWAQHQSTVASFPAQKGVTITADVSFMGRHEQAALAVIARDEEGSVLAVETGLARLDSVLQGELQAIGLALELASKSQWREFTIFSDSETAVKAIREGTPPPLSSAISEFFEVLDLAQSSSTGRVVWFNRTKNFVAHAICRWARMESVSGRVNVADLPSFVRQLLMLNEMPC